MTATNFRDLLDPWTLFVADDGHPGLRVANPDEILAMPVPWVDCPTCKGEAMTFDLRCDNCGASASLPFGQTCSNHLAKPLPCPACTGTGKATVAQLLAWGTAIAQTDPEDWIEFSDQRSAVEGYRNRILGATP